VMTPTKAKLVLIVFLPRHGSDTKR
jgi:hypothetical protein